MLLSCKNIRKSFGANDILIDASVIIGKKEKVAIVGVNGAGKTTFLKILTGEIPSDSGEIYYSKNIRLGYMSQISNININNTVYEEMLTVFGDLIEIENTLHILEEEISCYDGDALNLAMDKYSTLSQEFEEKNGYKYKSLLRGVLAGLGFSAEDYDRKISEFSGGEKTRIALGKLLLIAPDVLLLDEPTNHLDINAIQWLEEFLKNYDKSVVIISHDRYFINKIVNKVIEIENKKLTAYLGNYTSFSKQKEIDREINLKNYFDQQKEIKKQEESIKLLKSFNKEKTVKRAESMEKRLNKIALIEKPANLPDKVRITLEPTRQSGNDVLFIDRLKKSFDNELLFDNITFELKKCERVALIGPNGAGKTTIFRIIQNKLDKDAGEIKLGTNVTIGYYEQEHNNLNEHKTIFEEISDTCPKLTNTEIRNTLASFVFYDDNVFKTISTLSGGEKGRVALAKIMLSGANFLLLDEPTNHLDMYSKEILEQALRNYTGTILYISHDRYFINNTATKIIELTKNKVNIFLGDYDYYLEHRLMQNKIQEETKSVSSSKEDWFKKKEEQAEKRKLKSELEKTEREITNIETQLKQLDIRLTLEEVYTNPIITKEIYDIRQTLNENLSDLYEYWEKLCTTKE